MLKTIFCTWPLWVWRKLFGAQVAGATLAYLFAAVAFACGVIAGFSVDQPLATAEPARQLLRTTDRIEQTLLTAQVAVSRRPGLAEIENSLAAARRDIRTEAETLRLLTAASGGAVVTTYDQGRLFMKWLGPTLFAGSLLLLLFIAAMFHPGFRSAVGRTGSLTVGSFTFKLEDMSVVRESLRQRHSEVDRAISKTYLEKLLAQNMESLFANVKAQMNVVFKEHLGVDLDGISHRATLYVPGFFGDELVQAAGYLGAGMKFSHTGAGRRFSVRYGIIGKAWRLRHSQYNWDVNNKDRNLIRNWGLTFQEASKQDGTSKSLMAFVIPGESNQGDPLAVLYVEADGVKSLSPARASTELEQRIDDGMVKADQLAENIWRKVDWHSSVTALKQALIALRREFDWDMKIVSADGR